ncbi:MAG: hypothetical protein KGP29_04845 [Proteobacteria bacterium]|nr:hypothetical protein [Pseudomonadota bacterium]
MSDYGGIKELLLIEKYLKNYNRDLVSKLAEFLKNKEVLEFGVGIGTLAEIWKLQNGISPECLEIDRSLCDLVIQRGFKCYTSLDEVARNMMESTAQTFWSTLKMTSKCSENYILC